MSYQNQIWNRSMLLLCHAWLISQHDQAASWVGCLTHICILKKHPSEYIFICISICLSGKYQLNFNEAVDGSWIYTLCIQLRGKTMIPTWHIGSIVLVCILVLLIAAGCIFGPGHSEPPASRSGCPLRLPPNHSTPRHINYRSPMNDRRYIDCMSIFSILEP